MMNAAAPLDDAAILARVIRPDKPNLPTAAAQAILRLKFDAADRRRMSELLGKSGAGRLTRKEKGELESYRRVGLFLDLLASKARQSLRKPGRGA